MFNALESLMATWCLNPSEALSAAIFADMIRGFCSLGFGKKCCGQVSNRHNIALRQRNSLRLPLCRTFPPAGEVHQQHIERRRYLFLDSELLSTPRDSPPHPPHPTPNIPRLMSTYSVHTTLKEEIYIPLMRKVKIDGGQVPHKPPILPSPPPIRANSLLSLFLDHTILCAA